MMAMTKAERLDRVHKRALDEFSDIYSAVCEERAQCLEDREFCTVAGAQWAGALGEQFENKPMFEFNKVHLSVIRIINEYRNNRISVAFHAKNGIEDDDLADVCAGLYRADEQDSVADEAFDNGFEEAATGGIGAWRVTTCYEDESDPDDDRQRIRIEPIYDADQCVFFDLQSRRMDKSDARYVFVLTPMARDAYEEEYDDNPADWDHSVLGDFEWVTSDTVWLAEYYVTEETREVIHVWQMLDGSEKRIPDSEDYEQERTKQLAIGSKEMPQKRVTKKRVRKYILSGNKVLDDCGYIPGTELPVVMVYGKRSVVGNVERCIGHVRLSKDAQRLKNMQVSKLAELSASHGVEKPILTPEQIAGHERMWSEDTVQNYPYLLVNPVTDASGNATPMGPIAYTKTPQVPQVMAALLQQTEQDIQDLLGNQQQGEEMVGNISTETAHLISNRLDMQTFIYMSNMAKAVKRTGQIWLSMAKDVYVEDGREMKTIGEQEEVDTVRLLEPRLNDKGEPESANDLSRAKLDVVTDVGPSSSTRRASTVRSLTQLAGITDDPETKQVISSMILLNMEGEGISDVRQYFRMRLVRMKVLEPTEAEQQLLAEEAQNMKPTPNDEYLQAAAVNERAKAANEQADTIKKQADADKARAQTMEIMTDIDAAQQTQALELIEALGPTVVPQDLPGAPVNE